MTASNFMIMTFIDVLEKKNLKKKREKCQDVFVRIRRRLHCHHFSKDDESGEHVHILHFIGPSQRSNNSCTHFSGYYK